MRARRAEMVCECCKAPISYGARIVMFAGRPWLPRHFLAYKARRG